MTELLPYASQILVGIGLAAASGFRVFLPIFIMSLAGYFGHFTPMESFEWVSSLPVLIISGIATLAEILAYYIPVVDNVLDSLSIPMATLAGIVMMISQFGDFGSVPTWALSIIAGGGSAALISSGFAGARAGSTATTGGIGNGAVATVETAGAGILSFLVLKFPLIAGIIAIILVLLTIYLLKKILPALKKRFSKVW